MIRNSQVDIRVNGRALNSFTSYSGRECSMTYYKQTVKSTPYSFPFSSNTGKVHVQNSLINVVFRTTVTRDSYCITVYFHSQYAFSYSCKLRSTACRTLRNVHTQNSLTSCSGPVQSVTYIVNGLHQTENFHSPYGFPFHSKNITVVTQEGAHLEQFNVMFRTRVIHNTYIVNGLFKHS